MYSRSALSLERKSSQQLEEALLEAAKRGDNLEIGNLVAAGANINAKGHRSDERGRNALHLAAANGHTMTIDYLIKQHSMDVNVNDDRGETAYSLAAVNNKKETVCHLREKYAITIKSSIALVNALREAAGNGDNIRIYYLVECGANINKTGYGHNDRNALHLAAANGHTKTVDYLIKQYSMDINATTDKIDGGETAYTLAVVNGKTETARHLREKYAVTIKSSRELEYALKKPAKEGDNSQIDYLVANGVNINADGGFGTAYALAVINGKTETAHHLRKKHAVTVKSDITLERALHKAVEDGNNSQIDYLVAYGADVNAEYGTETAYTRAIVNGKTETAHHLREKYAVTIKSSRELEASLRKAAEEGDNNQIDYLIACGADVHAVIEYLPSYTDDGDGCLYEDPYDDRDRSDEGRNALHYAAIGGQIRTVDHLIVRYGMDVHVKDDNGETAYTLAVLNRKKETAKHLLKKYEIKRKSSPKLEECLREAAKQGDNDEIDYLVQYGADIHTKESHYDGKTAYIIAILANKRETARYLRTKYNVIPQSHPELEEKLLQAIDPLNKDTIDYLISCNVNSCKALHWATQTYNITAIDYLLEHHDVDINIKDEEGETAYTLAAARRDEDMVHYLLKKHAVKLKFSAKLQKALCEAAIDGRNNMIDYLIMCGADVNVKIKMDLKEDEWALYKAVENGERADINAEKKSSYDKIKRNALYYAVINDRIDTVEHLIKHYNVDIKVKDNEEETVLHWVATKSQIKTFHYLFSTYAIDISVKNSRGWTVYTLAVLNNKKEIADYLLEKCGVKKESSPELEFALLKAAERGDNARIDYLVQYGANVHTIGKNQKNEWPYYNLRDDNQNALHRAAANGHIATVKHLLEYYHMDANIEDGKGETAYTLAIGNKKNEIAHYLKIEHGVKLKSSIKLEIVLQDAAKRGDNAKINYCVENGADINAENNEGETAYTLAVVNSQKETAKYLQTKYAVKLKSSPQLENALLTAASSGDNAKIDYLVACGANIHTRVNKGNILCRAAVNGHSKTIDYLIEHYHMNINEESAEGETAYTSAVANSKKETAEYLKMKYTIKLKSSPELERALHSAVYDGDNAKIDYLVACGANIHATTENVLHVAAHGGHIATIDHLIEHYNLNINQEDHKGETPYTLAVSHNEKEMAKHLRRKYRCKLKSSPQLEQALLIAARCGDNTEIDYLVECGANVNTTVDLEGYEPEPEEYYEGIEGGGDGRNILHWAAVGGYINTIEHMVSHHLMMVNAEDNEGETAYTLAIANDKKKTADYLRITYAVRLKTSPKLERLLWSAAERSDHKEIGYLISCGADINAKDYWGDTVLHKLATNGQTKTIDYLVSSYNMYVNVKNNKGKTPLMLAIANHQKDTICYLNKKEMEQGCSIFHYAVKESNRTLLISACSVGLESINVTNSKGDTALHFAIKRGNIEFSKILILHGADVCIKNRAKESPHGILIGKGQSYFSTESKKWLLALMLRIESFGLSNYSFKADFSKDIRKKNESLLYFEYFTIEKAASIISKHIISSRGDSKFAKKAHKKSFIEMNKISYLKPLLGITAFAVEGKHELALNFKSESKKLRIIIDPDQSCTTTATLGGSSSSCGVYYRDNAIYLGGKRHADEDISRNLVRGTLIHEITHFVADEVFKNAAIPYTKDDLESKKWFDCIVDRIYHEFKRDPKSAPEIIACVFSGSYNKDLWQKELIVRIPQLIAMGKLEVVKTFCPDLLQYYNEKFLVDCKSHLLKLHHNNYIFLLKENKEASSKIPTDSALFEHYENESLSELNSFSNDDKMDSDFEGSEYESDSGINPSGEQLRRVTSPYSSSAAEVAYTFWSRPQSNSASSSSSVILPDSNSSASSQTLFFQPSCSESVMPDYDSSSSKDQDFSSLSLDF